MKIIPLSRGKVALVDDRFYRRLVQMGRWRATIGNKTWYARNDKLGYMHRVIVQLATGPQYRKVNRA